MKNIFLVILFSFFVSPSYSYAAGVDGPAPPQVRRLLKDFQAESEQLLTALRAAMTDQSDDSIATRRARILKATQGVHDFVAKVLRADIPLRDQRNLIRDVLGDVGFAFTEAVKPLRDGLNFENLYREDGEGRIHYAFRTGFKWAAIAATGVVRDVVTLVSPWYPAPPQALPKGYEAVTPTSSGGVSFFQQFSAGLRVPDLVPFFGSSARISRWAHKMAKNLQTTYDLALSESDEDVRGVGLDGMGVVLKEIDESETLLYGPQHTFMRWTYLSLGLLMAWQGPDFLDHGAYVTTVGLVASKLAYVLAGLAAHRTRTRNSSYHAYRVLQGLIDRLKVDRPNVFMEASDSEAASDAEVDGHLREAVGEPAVDCDAVLKQTKKKRPPRAA